MPPLRETLHLADRPTVRLDEPDIGMTWELGLVVL
jgi:hypothetical protein